MAAAYFVGNVDLHGGNMVVDTESGSGEVAVIDHDSAGTINERYRGIYDKVPDLGRFSTAGSIPTGGTAERIYELAQDIRSGERELDVPDYSAHADFAERAAEKAVRAAYIDPTYDLPDSQVPADLQFPPEPDIETLEDFDDPDDDPDEMYPVTFVGNSGEIVSAEVLQYDDEEDRLVVDAETGGVEFIEDPNRVVEIL